MKVKGTAGQCVLSWAGEQGLKLQWGWSRERQERVGKARGAGQRLWRASQAISRSLGIILRELKMQGKIFSRGTGQLRARTG